MHQQRRQRENGHRGQEKQQGLRNTPDLVKDDGQGDEEQGQPIKYFLEIFQRILLPRGSSDWRPTLPRQVIFRPG